MVESWNKMVLLSVDTSITLCNLQDIAFLNENLELLFLVIRNIYDQNGAA